MAMWWIENDNGWIYNVGQCVVLCEYVLHIFHEDTYNDIHDGKKKSMNYFLVSTIVLRSISCCLLQCSILLRFFITKNLIKCNVQKLTKH
jgi:hypothetical protein